RASREGRLEGLERGQASGGLLVCEGAVGREDPVARVGVDLGRRELLRHDLYFTRSLILAKAVRAHSSSNCPPGAPLTPIPPIAVSPALIVTPPTAWVTRRRGVCG